MGKGGEVKLIGTWVSPFTLRTRIALNLKSIDYEFLEEKAGTKSDLLLESNPVHKKIPVLLHHDRPICESLITVHYIDEVWSSGPSILPSDPYDRAVARFWAAYIDEKWFPALKTIRFTKVPEEIEKKLNEMREGLSLLEGAFVELSKGKSFFGGDQIGYVDIAFGGLLAWLRVREKNYSVSLLNATATPNLAGWAERLCAHPAVKDVMQDPDKLIEWVQINIDKLQQAPPAK